MNVLRRQLLGLSIVLDELRQIPRYNAEAERRLRQLRRRYEVVASDGDRATTNGGRRQTDNGHQPT